MTQAKRLTGFVVRGAIKAMQETSDITPLTNTMARPENAEIELTHLKQPKASAGFAFMLAKRITNPGVTLEQALDAVEFVIPALEVSDGFAIRYYITGGRPCRPHSLDLRTLGVVLEKDGHIVGMGAGAEFAGHPAQAIVAAAQHQAGQGKTLPEGNVILASGIIAEVDVAAQTHILGRYQDMGSVSLSFI